MRKTRYAASLELEPSYRYYLRLRRFLLKHEGEAEDTSSNIAFFLVLLRNRSVNSVRIEVDDSTWRLCFKKGDKEVSATGKGFWQVVDAAFEQYDRSDGFISELN